MVEFQKKCQGWLQVQRKCQPAPCQCFPSTKTMPPWVKDTASWVLTFFPQSSSNFSLPFCTAVFAFSLLSVAKRNKRSLSIINGNNENKNRNRNQETDRSSVRSLRHAGGARFLHSIVAPFLHSIFAFFLQSTFSTTEQLGCRVSLPWSAGDEISKSRNLKSRRSKRPPQAQDAFFGGWGLGTTLFRLFVCCCFCFCPPPPPTKVEPFVLVSVTFLVRYTKWPNRTCSRIKTQ